MVKHKVFVDSSILITAVLSTRGGSFYIFDTFFNACQFLINEYILAEVLEVLSRKFSKRPELKNRLFILLASCHIQVLDDPTIRSCKKLKSLIEIEDTPILAGAIKSSKFLLTLDNDFMSDQVLQYARSHKLIIMKPKDFITLLRDYKKHA